MTVMSVVIGVLGTVPKCQVKILEELENMRRVKTIQIPNNSITENI